MVRREASIHVRRGMMAPGKGLGTYMMFRQRNALPWAAVSIMALVAGCSNFGSDAWNETSPESQGYRWVGEGEPANFGSVYAFCRRTLRLDTQGTRMEGGTGMLTTQPGGPALVPGRFQTIQAGRSELGDRRQFQGCMGAQGWELVETAQPAPAGQSDSPAPSDKPAQPKQQ